MSSSLRTALDVIQQKYCQTPVTINSQNVRDGKEETYSNQINDYNVLVLTLMVTRVVITNYLSWMGELQGDRIKLCFINCLLLRLGFNL